MSRLPIIAANWKMHMTHTDAIQFAQKLHYVLDEGDYKGVEIVLAPPFTCLRTLQTLFDADRMSFKLGAQDVYWEDKGAFTGEVSPLMLKALDVDYVIVGHSERRELFGETDEWVRNKLEAVFRHGMTPILCVGETAGERELGGTNAKVVGQIEAATAGIEADLAARLVIAYEPIWAIGTGQPATADAAQEVVGLLRSVVGDRFGAEAAAAVRIQYGGSVKSGNVVEIMSRPDVDGALVGGASLDPQEFARILTAWQ